MPGLPPPSTKPPIIEPIPGPWYVYLLRCADGSLYAGITTDIHRRLAEHNAIRGPGARYTRARQPVELAYLEPAADRSAATRRERELKRLGRVAKQALVAGQGRSNRR